MISTAGRVGLTLAVAATLGGGARGYDGVTRVGETGERIVAFVRQAHEQAGFRGAVLAAQDGVVIAAVAVGPLGDGRGEPLRVNTLFEIASCSKSFTAIAILKLVDEGRLGLDDPIAEHLPGVPASCRGITVRHLLQHTSGIPGTNSRGRGDDLARVLPAFLEGGPRTTPGEKHEYWNQGYALLSEVIARAGRKPYTQYVRESVFQPCKMSSTRFTGQRAPRGGTVATGASSIGADRTALEHPYGEYGFQYRGMGGVVTNLIDLWRWDRALAGGGLLSRESQAEMTRPGPGGYALSWRIKTLPSGAVVHEHTGSVRGFLASIRRHPADDGCLFVLANSDDAAPFRLVQTGCERLLEGGTPPTITPPPEDRLLEASLIAELAGGYRDRQGRTLTVIPAGRQARAVIDWHGLKTYGVLTATDGEDLAFGPPAWQNARSAEAAGRITVEREGDRVVALRLTITGVDKSIRFDRQDE